MPSARRQTLPGTSQLRRPKAAAWPRKLFLWASEGNVRHPRTPPANVSAGRLRAREPFWGPFARLQTLLGCEQCRLPGVKPFPGPLLHSCTAALPGVSKAPVACARKPSSGADSAGFKPFPGRLAGLDILLLKVRLPDARSQFSTCIPPTLRTLFSRRRLVCGLNAPRRQR